MTDIGQGYELRVELPAGIIDAAWQEQAAEAFHQAHEREYVRRFPVSDIQIVNISLMTPQLHKMKKSLLHQAILKSWVFNYH